MASTLRQLNSLAQLYGVQTAYKDVRGVRHQASRETLQGVLAAMGVPLDSGGGVDEALRLRRKEIGERVCEPVLVAWDGQLPEIEVRLPESRAEQAVHLLLEGETGNREQQTHDPSTLPTVSEDQVDGSRFVVKRLPGFQQLPLGYHRLRVEARANAAEALVISAPKKAYSPPPTSRDAGAWGGLAPLYALHSRRSLGAGDLADFETLWQWIASLGGQVVATLPILATYLAEPFDPSPYSPISRLFWNEFYLALERIPELGACPAAQELLNSSVFREEVTARREASLVDYRPQMAMRRRVVELLAEHCFQAGGSRWESWQQYAASHAAIQDYARFRAAGERQASPWPAWPERLRHGRIEPQDYEPSVYCYHLYAQWVPAYVNGAMRRHAVRSTYVVQYELQPQSDRPLKPVGRPAVASVNTHDMPPFAAYWQGKDLDDLQALGLFDENAILAEHEKRDAIRQGLLAWLRRADDVPGEGHGQQVGRATRSERLRSTDDPPGDAESVENVLAAVHRWLATSPVEILLVNLEDLWLEVIPQNTPGTTAQRPNWQRKMRYCLETLYETPHFRETLETVNRLRRGRCDGVGEVLRPPRGPSTFSANLPRRDLS